jgi:DNA-binding NarL/FixJ family response regulator
VTLAPAPPAVRPPLDPIGSPPAASPNAAAVPGRATGGTALVVVDPVTRRITAASEPALDVLRTTRDHLLGLDAAAIVADEHRARAHHVDTFVASGLVASCDDERRHRRADGTTFAATVSTTAVLDGAGRVCALVCTLLVHNDAGHEEPTAQVPVATSRRRAAPSAPVAEPEPAAARTRTVVVDDHWNVVATGPDDVGCEGFLAEVHGRDLAVLVDRYLDVFDGRSSEAVARVRMAVAGGWAWHDVHLASIVERGRGLVVVTARPVVAGEAPTTAELTRRVEELELRLRRIGKDIEEAGMMPTGSELVDQVRRLPELRDLPLRHWEILDRLIAGQRVPSIARDLHLGQSTVRTHLTAIFRRLRVGSQEELLDLLHRRAREVAA